MENWMEGIGFLNRALSIQHSAFSQNLRWLTCRFPFITATPSSSQLLGTVVWLNADC